MVWLCKLLIMINFIQASAAQSSTGDVKFDKRKIKLNKHVIEVEIADRPHKQALGLMYREKLAEGHGMLFIFPIEKIQKFWMKNTFIPLSIGFFNKDKKLINFLDMKPSTSLAQQDYPTYDSEKPAQFVLEVPQGWFKKNNIKPGDGFDFVITP